MKQTLQIVITPEQLQVATLAARKPAQFVGFQCLCGERHANLKDLLDCYENTRAANAQKLGDVAISHVAA